MSETPASPATPSGNFAQLAAQRAAQSGWWDRPLFRTPSGVWSHGDLHHQAVSVNRFLGDRGVGAGDSVLVAAKDRIGLVLTLLGAARLGATTVLVNPTLTVDDHRELAGDAKPAMVVCEDELVSRFETSVPTVAVDTLAAAGAARSPAAAIGSPKTVPASACLSAPAAAPDYPLYIQYTSGTTGIPKAVMHRHSDPLGYLRAMGEEVLALTPDDVVYSISKAFFAYGLGNTIFFPLLSGCSAVLDPDRPTPGSTAAYAQREAVTVFFAVPTFYARLVASAPSSPFPALRAAVSAGETLQPTLYRRCRSWLGCDILDGLGSTEVGQTFISNTMGRCRPGTVGTVLPGYQVEVRSPDGAAAPRGEIGTLWVRGDTVMLGYRNRPDESAKVLVDGWCRTGDRASIDADGYVQLHGRIDDIETVGGINVSPLEVEAVLLDHPAVVEIATAAVIDADGASRLRAFAVLDPAVPWSPELEAEILALARRELAPHKVPRSVLAVEALPRTATGKLRRHVLRSGWPPP